MQHTKVNCSSCNKELMIKVAKGDNLPDLILCKECMYEPQTRNQPQKVKMNLGDALEIAKKETTRKKRCFGRPKRWHVVGKNKPTKRESGMRKRIYGS